MARDFIAMHIRMTWFKVMVMVNQFDQSIVKPVQRLYCTYKRGELARAVCPLLSRTHRERETGCSSINSTSSRGGVSVESYGARGRVQQHSIAKVDRQQQFARERKGTDWHTAYCISHVAYRIQLHVPHAMPLAHTDTLGTTNGEQETKENSMKAAKDEDGVREDLDATD